MAAVTIQARSSEKPMLAYLGPLAVFAELSESATGAKITAITLLTSPPDAIVFTNLGAFAFRFGLGEM